MNIGHVEAVQAFVKKICPSTPALPSASPASRKKRRPCPSAAPFQDEGLWLAFNQVKKKAEKELSKEAAEIVRILVSAGMEKRLTPDEALPSAAIPRPSKDEKSEQEREEIKAAQTPSDTSFLKRLYSQNRPFSDVI